MRRLLSTATAVILLLLLAEPAIASDSTVDLLGRLPSVEEVALSPAGSHVALTSTAGGQHVVAVMSLVAGKPGGKVNLGDQKVRFIEWADEESLATPLLRRVAEMITEAEAGARELSWHNLADLAAADARQSPE